MGLPAFKLEQQFPSHTIEIYSSNYALYGDLSARVMETVAQWTGIHISIGIGETKTLAKLANRIAKRAREAEGVCDLTAAAAREEVLARIPVEDIWSIGPSYSRLLKVWHKYFRRDFDTKRRECCSPNSSQPSKSSPRSLTQKIGNSRHG